MYYRHFLKALFLVLLLFPSFLSAEEVARNTVGQQKTTHGVGILQAIRAAIIKNPSVLIQQNETSRKQGALQQTSGAFDTTFTGSVTESRTYTPLAISDQTTFGVPNLKTDTTSYDLTATKTLRSGITLQPGMTVTKGKDNNPVANIYEVPANAVAVNFTLNVPLLRGLGEEATAGSETAARINYESSESALQHIVAQTVLTVAQTYWGAVAARRNFEIARDAEANAQKMVNEFRTLIANDQFPASAMDQVASNLASKTSLRLAAEQAYFEQKQQLAIAMGMPATDMASPPDPSTGFTELDIKPFSGNLDVRPIIKESLQHRRDLTALQQSKQAAEALVTAAELNKKPKLDLSFNLGHDNRVGGTNAAAQLSYEFPVENNALRGALAQRIAEDAQIEIQRDDLVRTITSEVMVAVSAISKSAMEFEKSKEAVELSQSAVIKEKKKLANGMSTVIDVINLENSHISALQNEVLAKQNYANAIVKLRYATGTLLSDTSKEHSIGLDAVTKLPDFYGM